mmetsp:Transcript_22851/g.54007  ORF Transcript_22851/g.54007 Transcript_22851/m.54007 type:complete len:217 (-) Transcript_22851:180-830(-)
MQLSHRKRLGGEGRRCLELFSTAQDDADVVHYRRRFNMIISVDCSGDVQRLGVRLQCRLQVADGGVDDAQVIASGGDIKVEWTQCHLAYPECTSVACNGALWFVHGGQHHAHLMTHRRDRSRALTIVCFEYWESTLKDRQRRRKLFLCFQDHGDVDQHRPNVTVCRTLDFCRHLDGFVERVQSLIELLGDEKSRAQVAECGDNKGVSWAVCPLQHR